ncbi:MAG TPA: hypothetical protein VMN36_12095 [Verrucomicrobiales bacterium]|nr:hypothetical protein [Verrucomicrobiales bacterium]
MKIAISNCGQRRRVRRRASALVVVFWLLAVLTMAIFTSLQLVSSDVEMIASQKHEFRASQLCEMGIALAANPQVERYDPLLTQYDASAAEGFRAVIRGEGGRLGINQVLQRGEEGRLLLEAMFVNWGLERAMADEIISCLIDWTDGDDLVTVGGAELDWYEEQGFFGYPFNRPFYDVEEMALVRGMELVSQVRPDWRDFFTLYGSGRIDLAEASYDLLVSVGVNPSDAENLVRERMGADEIELTEDDVQFGSVEEAMALIPLSAGDPVLANSFTVNEGTVRIESTARVADYEKTVVMIIQNRESTPVILSREEFLKP